MESDPIIHLGATAEIALEVRYEDTAHALSVLTDDTFPEVLSTSRMIALMELAAAKLLRPLLKESELSVGVVVNVRHLATRGRPRACRRDLPRARGQDASLPRGGVRRCGPHRRRRAHARHHRHPEAGSRRREAQGAG